MCMRTISSGPFLFQSYILEHPVILLVDSEGPDLGLRCSHMFDNTFRMVRPISPRLPYIPVEYRLYEYTYVIRAHMFCTVWGGGCLNPLHAIQLVSGANKKVIVEDFLSLFWISRSCLTLEYTDTIEQRL